MPRGVQLTADQLWARNRLEAEQEWQPPPGICQQGPLKLSEAFSCMNFFLCFHFRVEEAETANYVSDSLRVTHVMETGSDPGLTLGSLNHEALLLPWM